MAGKEIVAYNIDDQIIYVESEAPEGRTGFAAADGEKVITKAVTTFDQSIDPVVKFAQKMISRLTELEVQQPTEIELEFGIKLTGDVNFWVISGKGEGFINLKLTWKNS